MFCPECGNQNDERANFCGKCGASLTGGNSARNGAGDSSAKVDAVDISALQSAPPSAPQLDMPSQNTRRTVSLGVVLFVVGMVASVLIWAIVRPSVAVVESIPAKDTSVLSRNNTNEESDSVASDDSQEKKAEEKTESDSAQASESVSASELQDTALTVPNELEGKKVVWSNVADYDGDGKKEAFVLTGESFGTVAFNKRDIWCHPTLWFKPTVHEASVVETQMSLKPFVYVNDVFSDPSDSGYTLLSLEVSEGELETHSRVFGVCEGSLKEILVSGRDGRKFSDVQLLDGKIVAGHIFYDPEGRHREKWFEATFDVDVFQLVEGESLGETWLHELPNTKG